LPLSETTLPQVLKTAGYTTGWVGKWHLGAHPQFHPLKRGFDETFGFLGGGHAYLPGGSPSSEYNIEFDHNGKPEAPTKYITEHFGDEAAAFIMRHRGQPWFLYLAFNAPHTPMQATDPWLDKVKDIPDERRRTLAAMTVAMDDSVGRVRKALRDAGAEQDTLVFFFSDNGGPISVTPCSNAPLRGAKGSIFEGGVRVPFVVSWPGKLKEGTRFEQPVISLDVFATACAAAGATVPEKVKLDGVDILPALSGASSAAPHERLFWRTGGGESFAVRQGDWKWAKPAGAEKGMLFNLKDDVSEKTDLSARNPEIAAELEKSVMAWNKELIPPLFQSPRPEGQKRKQPAQVIRKK
jgi:arylsulfatase A-like enzyme